MPSSSPAQARLMRAVAHGWYKPGGGGPSEKVAKEFVNADKAKGIHMRKGGMKPKAPRLPPALMAAAENAPPPNAMAGPAAGPAAPPPPSGMGMKKGGVVPKTVATPSDETKEKKWNADMKKDAKGMKVAMKSGGCVKGYSKGGAVRGDGCAERGRTRGTFR